MPTQKGVEHWTNGQSCEAKKSTSQLPEVLADQQYVRGKYYITNPSNALVRGNHGKSCKITIHLHCLIPPKMDHSMIPVGGCWRFQPLMVVSWQQRVILYMLGVNPSQDASCKSRFIGIPYWKCKDPGGHCYWGHTQCICVVFHAYQISEPFFHNMFELLVRLVTLELGASVLTVVIPTACHIRWLILDPNQILNLVLVCFEPFSNKTCVYCIYGKKVADVHIYIYYNTYTD